MSGESRIRRLLPGLHTLRQLCQILFHLGELLDPPSVAMHGDSDTPLQGGYAIEPYVVAGLSVNRYIYDLNDLKNSRWSVPLGSSGHPGSPHYADQAHIWADVQLIPMLYDWDTIQAKAESRQSLSPGT